MQKKISICYIFPPLLIPIFFFKMAENYDITVYDLSLKRIFGEHAICFSGNRVCHANSSIFCPDIEMSILISCACWNLKTFTIVNYFRPQCVRPINWSTISNMQFVNTINNVQINLASCGTLRENKH